MSKIFIQNPTLENVAVSVAVGEGSSITNVGPDGAVAVYGDRTSICLAPEPVIAEPAVMTSDIINLTGKYVIQVNGEFVPFIFNAEDLGTYFDANDSNSTGVQFESDLVTE